MTLVLDTSAILALTDRKDPANRSVTGRFSAEPGSQVVPAGILSEAAYMLDRALGQTSVERFLADLEAGDILLDCGEEDFPRIRELVGRYSNLPLGFADASVVACAERRAATVLTVDRRDFDVVAGETGITIAP